MFKIDTIPDELTDEEVAKILSDLISECVESKVCFASQIEKLSARIHEKNCEIETRKKMELELNGIVENQVVRQSKPVKLIGPCSTTLQDQGTSKVE